MPAQASLPNRIKPRVFIDADVLFAGSAAPSEHGASLVVLRMAEISLIEALTVLPPGDFILRLRDLLARL